MKWIKNNLLNLYIISNILFVFFNSYSFITKSSTYGDFGDNIVSFLMINSVVAIILFIIKIRKKEYSIKIYDVLLLIVGILAFISSMLAINKDVALNGFKGRYEGLYSLLYYFTLLFLCSFVKKEDKKKIIFVILFTGVFQAFYAFLQLADSESVSVSRNLGTIWANGLTNNPNFFGSYMLLCLSYSIGLFLEEGKKHLKIIYGIVLVILFTGLLVSNTTSCAVGLIGVIIYSVIYLLKRKDYEKIIVIFSILIFTAATVNMFDKTTLFKDLVKTKNEAVEIAKGNNSDSFGTKRMQVWKATMKVVPKYLIHGAGVDNYFFIFDKGPLVIGRYFYDKAHNEYLQILVTQGIFSLISYLLLYLVIILKGIKNTYDNKNLYLILPVGGYLIQAFFNISVIEVAPIFFIALGLLIDRDDNTSIYKSYIKRLLDIVFSFILIVLLLPLFIIISICIKLIDKDKIFYIQERTGRDGRVFNIYKFRTMNNKHINKFGGLLRKTSLDELPQLINILKGDMSFIGPRPWIVDYYKLFDKKQKIRVSVRPGVTGLAQVNGRNSINIFKKIEYDIEYVNNLSFLLDFKILFRSIKVIFDKENIDMDKNIKKELDDLKKKKTK